MALEFRCPSCSRILRTPDESAGKKARCPQCGAIVDIPAASDPLATMSAAPPPTGESPGATPLGGPPSAPAPPSLGTPLPSSAPSSPFGSTPAPEPFSAAGTNPANPFGDASASSPFGAAVGPKVASDNPYAAPAFGGETFDPQASAAPGQLVHCRANMDSIFRICWDALTRQLGMALVLGLVAVGVNFGVSMVGNVIAQVGAAANDPVILVITQLISQAIGFLGQAWIQLGLILTTLRWARTDQIQIGDLFAVGPVFGRGLLQMILVNLTIGIPILGCLAPILITIPFQDVTVTVIVAVICGLLAIVVGGYLGLRLYLTMYFAIDRRTGFLESMERSSHYMNGSKLTVLLMGIVVGVGGLLFMIVTCCIGAVAVTPFAAMVSTVAYLQITGQPIFKPVKYALNPAVAPSFPANPT